MSFSQIAHNAAATVVNETVTSLQGVGKKYEHSYSNNQTTLPVNQYPSSSTLSTIPCRFPLTPAFDYTSLTLAISIILLNGLVLSLFCTKRTLRRLPGNYILASLSLNDMLNGLFALYKLIPHFYLHNNNCAVNQIIFFQMEHPTISRTIYRALMLSSVMHLVLLSSDRMIYVVYALSYNSLVSKGKVIKLLGITWMCCFIASGVQLTWSLIDGPLNQHRRILKFYHTLILAVLFVGFPSIILFVQSITMVVIVRKLNSTSGHSSQCNSGRKAFILYICMYMKFVLFSYPYFIISLLLEFRQGYIFIDGDVLILMIRVLLIMRFLPCLVNPCLYSLQNKDYRLVIKSIFRKMKQRKFNSMDIRRRYSPTITNETTEVIDML